MDKGVVEDPKWYYREKHFSYFKQRIMIAKKKIVAFYDKRALEYVPKIGIFWKKRQSPYFPKILGWNIREQSNTNS